MEKIVELRKKSGKFVGRYYLQMDPYNCWVQIGYLKGILRLAHLPKLLIECEAIPEYDTFGGFLQKYSFMPAEKYRIRSSTFGNNIQKFWVEHYDPEHGKFIKSEPLTLIIRNGGISFERIYNAYVEEINMSLSDLALLLGDYHTPLPHDLSYWQVCDVVAKAIEIK